MAQTARWLSVGEAAARLHRTDREVLALVFAGALDSELRLDHYEVTAVSVEAYATRLDIAAPGSELAAREGEDLAENASGPTVRGGPKLPLDIEDEFQRGKDDA
jgi:hypothetical protein